MNSATGTPGLAPSGPSSSSNSSPFADYMNPNLQQPSTSVNSSTSTSTSAATASATFPDAAGNSQLNMTLSQLDPTDHLQQLKQMTQGVGLMKADAELNAGTSANPVVSSNFPPELYTQYAYSWQYYNQFTQPMVGQSAAAAAFSSWPTNPYSGAQWQYAQTKKGRQTYQRYQTNILEQRFQQNSYVSKKQREELRSQTGLSDRQIKIWFQNRRMKAKKEKNRCEEQSQDQQSIALPSTTKSGLPSGLGGLSGAHSNGAVNQLLNAHQLDLGILDSDEKKSLSSSMSPVWPGMNMHAMAAVPHDPMGGWPQMLPQGTSMQPQAGHGQPIHGYPYGISAYPICPPNS